MYRTKYCIPKLAPRFMNILDGCDLAFLTYVPPTVQKFVKRLIQPIRLTGLTQSRIGQEQVRMV